MNPFDFVLGSAFVTYYCVGIIAIASFFVFRLSWQAVSLYRRLGDVRGQLDLLPGKEGLASGFESYDTHVKAAIGLPWTEFVETLVLPDPGSGDPIRNASDVSQYLNDATVIFPRISSGFYQSMPNLLTGAGILGTFIGLAGGVGAASAGLSSGNPGEITASLQRLLDGASLAFLTSIVGISCSMLFVIVERVASRQLHLSLDRWVGAIESRLKRVTPESVALEQLDQARRATTQLERFNTDLVFAIEQALEEKIAGRLSPHLEQLVKAVEGLRGDRATDAGKMIENALGRFTDVLQAKAGSQFDEMASIVSDLNRTLKETAGGMAQTVGSVTQALAQTGADAADQISKSAGGLLAAAENLEKSSVQNQQALAGMNRFVEEINTLRETIDTAHRQIADIAAPVDRAARDIRVASDKTADTLAQTNELVGRIDTSINQLEQHQQVVAAAWKHYQEHFEDIDRSLAKVFSQLDEGLSGYCEQVKNFANELDGTTAKTTTALATATAELNESIEDLRSALQVGRSR